MVDATGEENRAEQGESQGQEGGCNFKYVDQIRPL